MAKMHIPKNLFPNQFKKGRYGEHEFRNILHVSAVTKKTFKQSLPTVYGLVNFTDER